MCPFPAFPDCPSIRPVRLSDGFLSARPALAIDLGLGACVVAVGAAAENGDVRMLACVEEPMERGHQERIAPLVQQVMSVAGVTFADLCRVGVIVGPGSFTGLRVGLSFARTLALALGVECVGVTSLAALFRSASLPATDGVSVVAIPSRQGQYYVEIYSDGVCVVAADLLDVTGIAARLAEVWTGGRLHWIGPAAAGLSVLAPGEILPMAWPKAAALIELTLAAPTPGAPPRPLYLRAPDARTIAERQALV